MSLRTRVGRPRTVPAPLPAAAVLVVASVTVAFVAGCSAAGDGAARPSGGDRTGSRTLADLLLGPSAFPAQYPAVVLPPQAVSQAAPDLTGIAPGARVDPAGCTSPPRDYGPDGTTMVVGTDSVNRSTITIELARVDEPLAEQAAHIAECPTVTATRNGVDAVVRTDLTPSPTIVADETLALRRTVTSGSGGQVVTQSMVTLAAQVEDVRIQATAMSFGAVTDSDVLASLFAAAVSKVRGS